MSADEILCGLIKMGESVSPELFTRFQGSKPSLRHLIIDVLETLFWGCCSKPGVWGWAVGGGEELVSSAALNGFVSGGLRIVVCSIRGVLNP